MMGFYDGSLPVHWETEWFYLDIACLVGSLDGKMVLQTDKGHVVVLVTVEEPVLMLYGTIYNIFSVHHSVLASSNLQQ